MSDTPSDTPIQDSFYFSCDEGVVPILTEDEIKRICDYVLRDQGVTRACTLSISHVQNDTMQALNTKYRDTPRPTDVISLECERPSDPDLADGEVCELGDIIFAPAYIKDQADRFNMAHEDECRLLLIHAVLHLLGYDHLVEEEAQEMEALEDRLLIEVGTTKHVGHVEITRHRCGE